MKITINEAMCLQKALRGRYAEMSQLREKCASRESYYGETPKVVEPLYDVKIVDAKCIAIENALLEIDSAIKKSNAVVTIDIEADKTELMKPLA